MNKMFAVLVQPLGAVATVSANHMANAKTLALAKLGRIGHRDLLSNQGYSPSLHEGECIALMPKSGRTEPIPEVFSPPLKMYWCTRKSAENTDIRIGVLAENEREALDVLAQKLELLKTGGFEAPEPTAINWQIA